MGKKKQQPQPPAQVKLVEAKPVKATTVVAEVEKAGDEAVGADAASDYEEDELELLQVDLGDMIKIKQVMDEAVAAAILEQVDEDYTWDNIKLAVMFVACLFAMVAQFAPIPFPESRPVLGVCGTLYFAMSAVLQLITTFIDQDAILSTKPLPEDEENKNKEMEKYGLRVRTNMPRFSEFYTVIIEFQKPNSEAASIEKQRVEQTWSVGQFFDKEGYFDEVGVMDEVEKLFQRFEARDYDKPKSSLEDNKKKQ